MKVYADPLLAETVPDGTFGGARPRRRGRKRRPAHDPEGARRFAALAAAVAEADKCHGYGVNHRYRKEATTERKTA